MATCLSCKDGFGLSSSLPQNDCNVVCGTGCKTCTPSNNCTECVTTSNFIATNGTCVSACSAGEYNTTDSGKKCLKCSDKYPGCTSCTATNCTGCPMTAYLNSTGANDVSTCKTCSDSITDCMACTNATACTACGTKYLALNNATCVDSCGTNEAKVDTAPKRCATASTNSSFGSIKYIAGAVVMLLALLF